MPALLSSPILFNHVDKKKKDRLHMRAGRKSDESGRTRISLSLSLAHIQTRSIFKKSFSLITFTKVKSCCSTGGKEKTSFKRHGVKHHSDVTSVPHTPPPLREVKQTGRKWNQNKVTETKRRT